MVDNNTYLEVYDPNVGNIYYVDGEHSYYLLEEVIPSMLNLNSHYLIIFPSTAKFAIQSMPKIQIPMAQIEEVRQEHNITKNGNSGMEIHVKFRVQGMLGEQGKIVVLFYDESENKLLLTSRENGSDSSYRTQDGQLTVLDTFIPESGNAIYKDFILFIPYSEFHTIYQIGKHIMKFDVTIQYKQGQIASTYYYGFYYEND